MTCSVEGCNLKAAHKTFCEKHYARHLKGQDLSVKSRYEKTYKERFFEKIDVKGPDDCWLWKGSKDQKGYGIFRDTPAHTIRSHRYMYMLELGEIPEKMLICHKCDNPSCVNPAHLFIGTDADNMIDMVKKNRHSSGKWDNKLRVDDILDVRASNRSRKELAKFYGVSVSAIEMIKMRKNWKHI